MQDTSTLKDASRGRRALALARAMTLALPAAALAQSGPGGLDQRTWLSLQMQSASIHSSSYEAGYATGQLSRVQNEDDLGVPGRASVPGLAFGRRIGERWRIEVDGTAFRRSRTTVLGRDLDLDGPIFAAGSSVRTEVFVNTWRVSGGWSFIKSDESEVGVLIGGQNVHLTTHIDGSSSAGPGSPATPTQRELSNNGLVPAVGLYGQHSLTDAWTLTGHLDVALQEKYTRLSVGALWRMTPNLGLGLGWSHTESRFDITTVFIGVSRDVLSYRASGPQLTLTASF